MTERGVIQHVQRAKQLILFEGCTIKNTNITPTDIDAIVEYHNKSWILIEVKCTGKEVDTGQDLLIKRFVEDGKKAGKDNIGVVVEHDVSNCNDVIMLKDCKVRNIYVYEKDGVKCRPPKQNDIKVNDFLNKWVEYLEKQNQNTIKP